ncbi:MAG: CheB methylesterase domain-containing protein, partial [Gemmatimonadota bacterium]
PEVVAPEKPARPVGVSRYTLLALGASTGGPRALASILYALPVDFPAGVVIAQHMPPGFTGTLAERLDRRAAITVREAADGDTVEPGVALIGVGGRQIRVEASGDRLVVRIPPDGDGLLHRPSVDVLFSSVADTVGDRAVGAVLTGMGEDGAKGLTAMRAAGSRTFAESADTAVIFGMPRAAAPAAEQILPLDRLARALREIFMEREAG